MTSWPVNQTIPSLSAPWMFSSSANNNQIGSSPSAPWTFSSSANEEQGAKTFNALRSQASHVQHRWSSDQMDEMEMCTIERIDDCISTPLIQESPNMITQKPFPFLSLPGEIRNNIYRYALVSPKPYTVKLQFPPSDTGLLRANKQIYSEASTIFYHENTFRFPQTLFEGGAILERLWRVYHLPPWKLQRMRNFAIDIPIYGHHGGDLLRTQVERNHEELLLFLLKQTDPGVKLALDFIMAWGESDIMMSPWLYTPFVGKWKMMKFKAEVEIVVRTTAYDLDFWVDFLLSNGI